MGSIIAFPPNIYGLYSFSNHLARFVFLPAKVAAILMFWVFVPAAWAFQVPQ